MEFVYAKSSKEALDALIKYNGAARLIAGGSDVMVDMSVGKIQTEVLVDVTACKDMLDIKTEGKELVIGASVTLAEISKSDVIKKYYPSLAKGCGSVGSLQIRNSATLTGNVVTAQPAADGAMAVAPLMPEFVVLSKSGEKKVAMKDMYAGFGKSSLDPTKELIKEIRIPLPNNDEKASYVRLELRKSLSLPMLNVAAMAKIKNKKFEWVRITMGPVGVGPVRAAKAEEWLKGKEITKANMEEAGNMSLLDAKPRSNPLRGSKEYRESALPVLVRRALEEVVAQCK